MRPRACDTSDTANRAGQTSWPIQTDRCGRFSFPVIPIHATSYGQPGTASRLGSGGILLARDPFTPISENGAQKRPCELFSPSAARDIAAVTGYSADAAGGYSRRKLHIQRVQSGPRSLAHSSGASRLLRSAMPVIITMEALASARAICTAQPRQRTVECKGRSPRWKCQGRVKRRSVMPSLKT